MNKTKPLSGGSDKTIEYQMTDKGIVATWGITKFEIDENSVNRILVEFFVNPKAYYPLGANKSPVAPYGLGEFIVGLGVGLSAQYASAIAAILVAEEKLDFLQKGKAIFLSKKGEKSVL